MSGATNDAILRELQEHRNSRLWDIAMKATVPIVMALSGWGIAVEIRTARIEETMFTFRDAHTLEAKLREVYLPQAWLQKELAEMKSLLKDQDARLRAIEQKVK